MKLRITFGSSVYHLAVRYLFEMTFALRRKFCRHFLANSESNIAQLKILADSISHEIHVAKFCLPASPVLSRACSFSVLAISDHFEMIRQENGVNVF